MIKHNRKKRTPALAFKTNCQNKIYMLKKKNFTVIRLKIL